MNILNKTILILFFMALLGCSRGGTHHAIPLVQPDNLRTTGDLARLSRISSMILVPVVISEGAKECASRLDIDQYLERALRSEVGIELRLPKTNVSQILSTNLNVTISNAIALGAQIPVDAALITRIYSCVSRNGSRFGSEQPAIIGMTLSIFEIRTKKEIWSADYRVRDTALSENLLSLGTGRKPVKGFRTVADLVDEGFYLVAQQLENQRRSNLIK